MAHKLEQRPGLWLPSEFPYDFTPPPPSESFVGSTDTETEEENFLAGLTHQLTRTSLDETLKSKLLQHHFENISVNSGSPRFWSWSTGSSKRCPNGCSQVSLPQSKLLNGFNNSHFHHLNSSLQFEQQNLHQPISRSSMRTGFTGKKRKCAGTGVFLPRSYGGGNIPSASRNKPGCSTTNHPFRMVQALNNNFDDFTGIPQPPRHRGSQPWFNVGVVTDFDISMATRSALLTKQERYLCQERPLNLEIHLPQEWTY